MDASANTEENVVGTTQPGYMADENHGSKFVNDKENLVGTTQPGYMADENHGSTFVNDKESEVKEEAASAPGGVEGVEKAAAAAGGGGGKEEEIAIAGGGEKGEIASAAGEEEEGGGEEIASAAKENNLSSAPEKDEYWRYTPLVKAALRGDWETAKKFFDEGDNGTAALTGAQITPDLETVLHVAVCSGRSIDFVEKLVDLMPTEAFGLVKIDGLTALHVAAHIGDTKAAVILVEKHSDSLYMRDKENWLPVHRAACRQHKDTLLYLLSVTKEDYPTSMPFAYSSGVELLYWVVASEFYDVALSLVSRNPHIARSRPDDGRSALAELACKPYSFQSGTRLNCWERLIYSFVPIKLESYAKQDHDRGDIEDPVNSSQVIPQKYSWTRFLRENFFISVNQKFQAVLWKVLQLLVPHIKYIQEQKLMHNQALQLLKRLCKEIRSVNDSKVYESFYEDPILAAGRLGIHEVVEEIVESYPEALWLNDSENRNIFKLAVIHRHENIFNFVYQMSEYKHAILHFTDTSRNTILHLVGQLARHDKLNLIPGAALQMQRELQWFKEVEKFLLRRYKKLENDDGKTPATIFTEEHKELVKEGEKWMKDTATSCTIVAALIATIAFAATITVPGGNNGRNGLPIFLKEKTFIVFVVSNAISLFTSTTSLLMFLSILTSRFAEGDFLYVLPKRLIIGLITLFLSISTMIVAFSSCLYLVLDHSKAWMLIPIVALACLPITSFVSLQFPLLVDVISSTYGRGIFGRQSDRPFY